MAGGGELRANGYITDLGILVILVPFITGAFLLFLRAVELRRGKNFSENFTGYTGVAGLAISWILSILLAIEYFIGDGDYVKLGKDGHVDSVESNMEFLPSESSNSALNFGFEWGILIDPLSVLFLVALTTIATLIHFYATEYMHADPAYTRFFGTMNFFTGSMLGFVLANNLFMGFIFWELLGFSSYLLIGFYWQKRSASSAAKKAFLYNKVGDVSFLIGIALLYNETIEVGSPTLNYYELKQLIGSGAGQIQFADLALPAILIFGGAVGKSAQFPLFGWLPEAMEGPTPVSSLLHSSTMVKAGLFLIARNFFTFYEKAGDEYLSSKIPNLGNIHVNDIIAWTGMLTALMGALMALTATDIKRVLAFSTVSQLGYIALGIGAGGITAGFFHILSHATFKSLLFLCAGSVIHSVHSQEMGDMGGLKKYMPWTFWTMAIGLAGLAGIPPMNGFWSKDAVLLSIYDNEEIWMHTFVWFIAVLTAAITAFYSTKLLILTFLGEGRYDKDHVHPAPTGVRMRIPLVVLASLVVIESVWWGFGTLFGAKHGWFNFESGLHDMLGGAEGEFHFDIVPITSMLAVGVGILLAIGVYYGAEPRLANLLDLSITQTLHKVFDNRFGLDIAIYWFAEGPVMWVGEKFQKVDLEVIDGFFVHSVARDGALKAAELSDNFDQDVVDGFVNVLGDRTRDIGYSLRRFQRGQTGLYARFMSVGLAALLLLLAYRQFF